MAPSYNIYRATTPGGEGATPFVDGCQRRPGVSACKPRGSTYYYEISAVAGSHESSRSNEVKVTVPPLSAPVLSAQFAMLDLASGSADFRVQWTSPDPAAAKLAFNIYRSTTPGGEGATPYATGVTGTIAVPLSQPARHDVLLPGQRRGRQLRESPFQRGSGRSRHCRARPSSRSMRGA